MGVDWDEWAKDHYKEAAVLLDAAEILYAYAMYMASADTRWLASELIARADEYTMNRGSSSEAPDQ